MSNKKMNDTLENPSNDSSTINLLPTTVPNNGEGHYSVNLAFSSEDVKFINPDTKQVLVYSPLTESVENGSNLSKKPLEKYAISKSTIRKAIISACTLAATIIILYLWIHVKVVNPLILEIFEINPTTTEKIVTTTETITSNNLKTIWKVEYNLPNGIPVVRMNAEEMKGITNIDCPPRKFALALYVDSNLEYAETFLIACANNVAYFRVDGSSTMADIDKLHIYLPHAEALELKASLKIEKGESILDNPDFIKTMDGDDRIRTLEISGSVTFDDLAQLVEVVPLAEELTIKGDEVCKSLRRTLKSSKEACHISWPILSKLSLVETQECRAMYDLIYSCWDMPSIKILQIRRSIISKPNADYITGILDKNRITKVDFADNVCFDDTLQTVPFMCQASP